MSEFLILMKSELTVSVFIFVLLFIKIGKGMKNDSFLLLVQALLLANLLIGFLFPREGSLFDGMFYSNLLIAFQKNILSAGTFLISLLCAGWLKKHPHLPEFFMLMLFSLL